MDEICLIKFFQSIGDELDVVKNRVRHLIGSSHWGEEGRYKEAILRSVMQRFLPKKFSIGTGFILANDLIHYHITSQIDIIIYDNTSPLLFREGDFVIVTPSSVKAIIEVKTKITNDKFESVINKIIENAKIIRAGQPNCFEMKSEGHLEEKPKDLFIGLFSYEYDNESHIYLDKLKTIFTQLQTNQANPERYFINNIVLSKDVFLQLNENYYEGYSSKNLAYSFFMINLLKSLDFLSVWKDISIWSILDRHPDSEPICKIALLD